MSKSRPESDDILTDITLEISEKGPSTKSTFNTEHEGSSDALHKFYETVPEHAATDQVNNDNSSKVFLACCCLCSRDETSQDRSCCRNTRCLRRCLSSGLMYIYVLVATAVVTLLMLAELLMDLGLLINTPEPHDGLLAMENITAPQLAIVVPASLVLHWTSFSILCLFFIEIVLRVYAWKLSVVKSLIAVCDASVVTVALGTNIAATLAAGYKNYVSIAKQKFSQELEKSESCRAEIQILNQRLTKQVDEKEFEIKQLQAHLGGNTPEFDEEMTQALGKIHKQSGTSYDADLEKAIALSKKAYEEHGSGYDNPTYVDSDHQLRSRESLPSIVVHHRQNSIRRNHVDQPSTSRLGTDSFSAAEMSPYVTVVAHGAKPQPGGTDPVKSTDTSALLSSNSSTNNNHTWSAGYCLQQGEAPTMKDALADRDRNLNQAQVDCDVKRPNESRHLTEDPLEVTSCHSDEGIESVTSKSAETFRKHSRSNTIASTEGQSSDQSSASASSICSESDYHSDERAESNRSRRSIDIGKSKLVSSSLPSAQCPEKTVDQLELRESDGVTAVYAGEASDVYGHPFESLDNIDSNPVKPRGS